MLVVTSVVAQARPKKSETLVNSESQEESDLISKLPAILNGKSLYQISVAINKANHLKFEGKPSEAADVHFAIAGFFASQQAHRHAAEHYNKGLSYLNATQAGADRRFYMTLALADELELANRSDSALKTYQLAIRQAEILNNKALQSKGYQRLAEWNIEHHQAEKAIGLLDQARAIADSSDKFEIAIHSAIAELLAARTIDQNKMDQLVRSAKADDASVEFLQLYARFLITRNFDVKAGELLKKLDATVNGDKSRQAGLDHLKTGYYIALNETDEAKQLWLKAPMNFGELAQVAPSDELWDARLIGPQEERKIVEQAENPEVHISPVIVVGLCLLIVLLAILIGVITWPRISKTKVQSQEVWNLKQDQATALAAYSPSPRVTRVHKSVLDAVLKRVHSLIGEDSEHVQSELKTLVSQLEELLNLGRDKTTMLTNVDHLDDDFTHRLTNKYSFLNEREKQLAELVRLNLNTPEIALMLHISQISVEEQLKNLAVKVDLKPDEDLYLFIANI